MKLLDDVEKFYDRVFGNNDGVFNFKDITKSAPSIVAIICDLVMLVSEYRVFSVGYTLTHNTILALGFVAVSSIMFYLGQIAFLYTQANLGQKIISVLMVLGGLGISGYLGFAELLIGTTVNAGVANINPVDPSTLYYIVIAGTIGLILGGLSYGLIDDVIAQNLKASRIEAKARVAMNEIELKSKLLEKFKDIREKESHLQGSYQEDYEHVNNQFHKGKRNDNQEQPNRNQNPQNRMNNNRPSQNMQQQENMVRGGNGGSNHVADQSESRPSTELMRMPMPVQSQPKKSVFSEPQVRPFPSEKGLEESDKNPIELPHQEE